MHEITIEDFNTIIIALFKNKLLIVLFTIAGLCAGFFYYARKPVIYSYNATATISVVFNASANQGQISSIAVLANYTEMITSARVCKYAAELLENENVTADQVRGMIRTATRTNSYMLTITAQNQSPRLAILVANAVAQSFVTQVSVITGNDSIQILDAASTANLSESGGTKKTIAYAAAAAFVAACLLVTVMELAMNKVRLVKQCATDMDELLAVIPKTKKKRRK